MIKIPTLYFLATFISDSAVTGAGFWLTFESEVPGCYKVSFSTPCPFFFFFFFVMSWKQLSAPQNPRLNLLIIFVRKMPPQGIVLYEINVIR